MVEIYNGDGLIAIVGDDGNTIEIINEVNEESDGDYIEWHNKYQCNINITIYLNIKYFIFLFLLYLFFFSKKIQYGGQNYGGCGTISTIQTIKTVVPLSNQHS